MPRGLPVRSIHQLWPPLCSLGCATLSTMSDLVPCPGCGARFPAGSGATHRYIESSPGCWAVYGEVLAREYGDPDLFDRVHRLTVDAYAAQHPGQPSVQSIRSVALHLISLCLMIEQGATAKKTAVALKEATREKTRYFWLPPPASLGAITVADVRATTTTRAHEEIVRQWAEAVWLAWSPHHATVHSWLRKYPKT